MIVGYIQNAPRFGNKEENFKQVENLTRGLKADLLVLPELFATGYTLISRAEAVQMAESNEGGTARFLMKLSDATGAVVVGGFIEQEGDQIYNSALMVYGNSVIGSYRKIHLFYHEQFWFSPGNKPLPVYEVKGMKIGMMICFDWMFPETMRTLVLRGAQIVAHPANLVLPYCQYSMVTRCLENRAFAITANRVGRETRGNDDFLFTGKSQITDVEGKILASGDIDTPQVALTEIDIHRADNKDINSINNWVSDRRPEFYF